MRRASSQRMMREPSMLVRETATEQLEERQRNWAYSKSSMVLDIIWNMAFLVVMNNGHSKEEEGIDDIDEDRDEESDVDEDRDEESDVDAEEMKRRRRRWRDSSSITSPVKWVL
ncbi:hypothetical protein V6N11_018535 [Hibiscus sabdariffa]|uniref:Uncharacterized protein n=1 Tax=Hibiscus sabdariffa TaxID=183260 RepID=A0ABR2T8H8_9ROSI